jgi:hypothetical protein
MTKREWKIWRKDKLSKRALEKWRLEMVRRDYRAGKPRPCGL